MPDAQNVVTTDHLKLQSILAHAVDAIITIDELGVIESVNPATETLFQYSADELIGRNISTLMPSPYCEEHDYYLENYLASGKGKIIGRGREVVAQRKDGSRFPVHLAVSEMKLDGHRLFTGIIRDISDLKAAQARLSALNNELEERVRNRTHELKAAQAELVNKERLATLGQLSGGIAHEIRNPLNAVKASAYYLLHAEDASEAKRREHLMRIDRQVGAIDNVITALSEVAKLPEPTVSALSPTSLLSRVVREVSIPNGIQVELELPDDMATILADENQIPIVFHNLLRNARDAMPEGGVIRITSEQRQGKIAITVSDTGVGIPETDLPHIIEPLYSTKARGMGLGLAICKTIVERNGGRLLIDSSVGQGSSFTVELKAAEAPPGVQGG